MSITVTVDESIMLRCRVDGLDTCTKCTVANVILSSTIDYEDMIVIV